LTILVHEFVSGGGLAGSPLPPSWAAEGSAMRRALAADFASIAWGKVQVIVTLDARLADDPGPWTVEPITLGQEATRVRELARLADFTVLVAPETTGILAGLTRELQRVGARVLGSAPEAIDLTGDKAGLAAWLLARGIATPPSRTIIPRAGLPADIAYPCVLKPVDGAGSIDTFYLSDARSVPDGVRGMSVAVLQPFVPGVSMSASFLVDGTGKAWLIGVGTQHVTIRDGTFAYQGGALPASSRCGGDQVRPAVESVPGLRGFVGVDFLWDPQRRQATVLEINPRATTSCVGLTRLLPPGCLAEAWLGVFESPRGDPDLLSSLAERVHGQRRLSFDLTGRCTSNEAGAFV
jgi:predicted ATP-grasp superfamily ATP-dependent carboligase